MSTSWVLFFSIFLSRLLYHGHTSLMAVRSYLAVNSVEAQRTKDSVNATRKMAMNIGQVLSPSSRLTKLIQFVQKLETGRLYPD